MPDNGSVADFLFDTTVFIDYFDANLQAKVLVEKVLNGQSTASFSVITRYELWITRGLTEVTAEAYRSLLIYFEEVSLQGDMAEQVALWLRPLSRRPRERRIRDALIAATALLRNEPVCTRNIRDFRRFPGVRVIPY